MSENGIPAPKGAETWQHDTVLGISSERVAELSMQSRQKKEHAPHTLSIDVIDSPVLEVTKTYVAWDEVVAMSVDARLQPVTVYEPRRIK